MRHSARDRAAARARRTKGLTPEMMPSVEAQVPAIELLIGVLISAIEEKPHSFLCRRGRVGVELTDDRSLTLTFGDPHRPLSWGSEEGCELRLTMTQSVLTQILDGKIDATRELASGALRLEGDIELLRPLFQLLDRGRSLLSIRLGR